MPMIKATIREELWRLDETIHVKFLQNNLEKSVRYVLTTAAADTACWKKIRPEVRCTPVISANQKVEGGSSQVEDNWGNLARSC
jgi:hypothetical protein